MVDDDVPSAAAVFAALLRRPKRGRSDGVATYACVGGEGGEPRREAAEFGVLGQLCNCCLCG